MACSTSEETGTAYCFSRSGFLCHAGKVLGGGSAIKGMLYVRADRYNIYCPSRSGCVWHAGKVLGGGSAINGMLYVRGVWHAGKVLGGGSDINGMLYVRGDRYNILP